MNLVEIKTDDVIVQDNLREDPGDLTTLERSIRRSGLLFPIIISRQNVLISGTRRLRACRNIGMTTIQAMQMDIEPGSMAAIDLQCDENLCRLAMSSSELDKVIGAKKSLSQGGADALAKAKTFVKGLFSKGKPPDES